MDQSTSDRLIIAADIDCFYAQCEILNDPTLSPDTALGVQQKNCLVTCNYAARAKGVRKLQTMKDALATCPDLVIRDGSDIQPYRRASARVWEVLGRAVGVWDKIWADAGVPSNQAPTRIDALETFEPARPPLDPAVVANLPTKLERLGMDEFFMDVTALVDSHLDSLDLNGQSTNSLAWFPMPLFHDPSNQSLVSTGFTYTFNFTLPQGTHLIGPEPASPRLILAAHISSYVRQLIRNSTGYTTSAGISSSKVLAKIASDVRKPDGQSLVNVSPEEFVKDVEIGRIQGVGHKLQRDLEEWLGGRTVAAGGEIVPPVMENWLGNVPEVLPAEIAKRIGPDVPATKKRKRAIGVEVDIEELGPLGDEEEAGFEFREPDSDNDEDLEKSAGAHAHGKLTPAVLLPILEPPNPPASLTALLTKHPTLLPLLHGIDTNPVKMTLLPATISIEDSFRCSGTADLQQRLSNTIEWLIERIEEEEMVDVGGKRKWRRFPRNLRLSLRRFSGNYSAHSKTIGTPHALLDTSLPLATRIARTHKALEASLRGLLLMVNCGGSGEAEKIEKIEMSSKDVAVLNLAVSGFQKEWVEGSGDIGRFLVKGGSVGAEEKENGPVEPMPKPPPKITPGALAKLGIDVDVFNELPPELQNEIVRSGVAQDKVQPAVVVPPAKKKGGPMDRFLRS
jgi:nucleotidyltransferase/DNA polymerase involved in DNA repair